MPGKSGRRNAQKGKSSKNASDQVAGYDGPVDPRSSTSGAASRGRAPPTLPPESRGRSGSRGMNSPREGSRARSATRGHTEQSPPIILSRNVDFGGNAYNLGSNVSQLLLINQTVLCSSLVNWHP